MELNTYAVRGHAHPLARQQRHGSGLCGRRSGAGCRLPRIQLRDAHTDSALPGRQRIDARLGLATPPPLPASLVGKILFLGDANEDKKPELYMINPDGTGLAGLTGTELYAAARARDAVSADRRYTATVETEDIPYPVIVYSDSFYGTRTALTRFDKGAAWDPSWSPVDEKVLFVSNHSGNDEIYVTRIKEWPPQQLTNNTFEWDKSPSWSPDGTQIVFGSNRDSGLQQIWIMDADSVNQRKLVDFDFAVYDPVWVKYADE